MRVAPALAIALATVLAILLPAAAHADPRSDVPRTPAVAAGCDTTAVARADGTVWTWGANDLGQLGDGTTVDGEAPRQVLTAAATPLTGVVSVSIGCGTAYALRGDGSVWAWGSNEHGQLGIGSVVGPATCGATACSSYAVRVQTGAGPAYLAAVTDVDAGASHAVARRADGSVWAWGRGDGGQLGNQSTSGPDTCAGVGCSTWAIRVQDPSVSSGFLGSVLDVAAGDAATIAMRVDGQVVAWGDDGGGATGHGSSAGTTLAPTAVQQDIVGTPVLDRVKSIDGAGQTFRALRSSGTIHTWGAGGQGQLGNATTTAAQTRSVEVLDTAGLVALDNVREVVGGPDHAVAIRADGTAFAWGRNDWGQLGDLSQTQRTTPVQVADSTTPTWLGGVLHVTAGGTHSVAVLADGTVRSWGDDVRGQLGLASTPPACVGGRPCSMHAVAGSVAVGGGYRTVVAGDETSYALAADGTVRSWGNNNDGQMGIGDEDGLVSSPMTVVDAGGVPISGVIAISAGADNGMALRSDGTAWVWGDNAEGQLGQGSTTDSDWAVRIETATGVALPNNIGIAGIDRATFALGADGLVRAVGRNTYGVLGDASTSRRTRPVVVQQLGGSALDRVVQVIGRGGDIDHAAAVRDDGSAWGWGQNNDAQIGFGSDVGPETCGTTACSRQARPVLASAGVPLTRIATMGSSYRAGHAVTVEGHLLSWGTNTTGEVGNAMTSPTVIVPYPVRVATNDTNTAWVELATSAGGAEYTPFGLLGDGRAVGWGANEVGQVGDATTVSPRRWAVSVAGVGGAGTLGMVTAVDPGEDHGIARDADGRVVTWGSDTFGQLGSCTTTYESRAFPEQLQETCGSNLPPTLMKSAVQYRSDNSTVLPIGTWTNETTIVIRAEVGDPDDAQSLRAFVEIRPNNVAFSAACGDTADPAVFQSSASGLIPAGVSTTRTITVTGLVSGVQYHWRVCARDGGGTGASGPFYVPGGNPDISIDTSTPPPGMYGARQVAAGCDNTGVVLADGTVWMSGDGSFGQLGNGTTSGSSATPVQVRLGPAGAEPLTSVRSLSIGCGFAVAVRTDGLVYAWGRNDLGQLGATTATICGATACSEWAVQVDPVNVVSVKEVAAGGAFAMALRADGAVLAWGSNDRGQLGRGSVGGSSATAMPVRDTANTADLASITTIAAGSDFAVAGAVNGVVWSWGSNDDDQLGAGLAVGSDFATAQQVLTAAATPLTSIKRVAAGGDHSLALRDDGVLLSWGSNADGQLGINVAGGTGQYAAPVRDSGGTTLARWRGMSAGTAHGVAIRADGTVWSWGANADGQLGTQSGLGDVLVPTQIRDAGGTPVPETTSMFHTLAAGSRHTAGLRASGATWGWGRNDLGQLARVGADTDTLVLTDFSTGTGYLEATSNAFGSAALRADGTVATWGENNTGQLGNGTSKGQTPRIQTVEVSAGVPLANIIEVVGGEDYNFAIRADGTLWAWGYGSTGRLGNNSSSNRTRAVQVRNADDVADSGPPLIDVIDVAGHDEGGFALDAAGVVWAWGDTDTGEHGNGGCCASREWAEPVLRAAGVQLTGITSVAANSADGDDGFAVRSDGTVWAWGHNTHGQLGQGSNVGPDSCENGTACSRYAVQVLAAAATPLTGVQVVAVPDNAVIAAKADGSAWAWGDGYEGRLGNNSSADRLYPVQVRAASAAADTGTPLTDVIDLSAAENTVAAVDAAGRLLTWGDSASGELGNGGYSDRLYAAPAQSAPSGPDLAGVRSIGAGGRDHGVPLVDGSGRVQTVGANLNYQLADCTRAARPRYDVVREPCAGNLSPAVRWNIQYRADHSTRIQVGEWVSDGITTNVYLDFNVSDPDSGETVTPYIEFAPMGTPFDAACGDVAHPNVIAGTATALESGAGLSASFPVTGLTVGEQYHWRACAMDASGSISKWMHTGSPPTPDFGVDDSRPANPTTVDDGAERGVDVDVFYSLTAIDATWPFGIDGGGSGLVLYDYCVTTSSSGADCAAGATRTWTTNSWMTEVHATGLTLTHGTVYHVCVRATDGAGNQSIGHVCSDGQQARFTLTGVNPNAGVQGETGVTIELTGEGFLATDAVTILGGGITVQSVTRVSDTRLDVVIDIDAAATPGARTVQVAHTGSDTSQVQLASSFTVVAISITVSLSTLGYEDGARDALAPHAIAFGTLLPGDTRQLGPVGSGQSTVGAATEVTVVSNGAWRLQQSATDFGNGTGGVLSASALEWKHAGVAEAWSPFSTSATTIEGAGAGNPANDPGGTTYGYDWQVTVPPTQQPGAYTGTVTYTAIPAV